jgi:hypothetical protein
MEFHIKIDDNYIIPETRFDNKDYIEDRVNLIPSEAKGCLKTALKYLYLSDGPINLPRDRFKVAEIYLELAEIVLAHWLVTRTNGSLRVDYGKESLICARKAHYRCEICGYSDVRTLHIDHVEGRIKGTKFACICANCHNIKSREKDWSGERRYQTLEACHIMDKIRNVL